MVVTNEKSTDDPGNGKVRIHPEVILDGRLALYHTEDRWLALSDLHYGYEVSRRRAGGLWPLWGMEEISVRLRALVEDWKPARVILVGDVVDSCAAREDAIRWLQGVEEFCEELILITGNHDRGPVVQEFSFLPNYETEDFFFHHGHLPVPETGKTEICGHLHPSIKYHDGAGTAVRMPSFAIEKRPGLAERWILPAFSPWAGGGKFQAETEESEVAQWACTANRVFPASVTKEW